MLSGNRLVDRVDVAVHQPNPPQAAIQGTALSSRSMNGGGSSRAASITVECLVLCPYLEHFQNILLVFQNFPLFFLSYTYYWEA